MVEYVEELRPELQREALRNLEGFEEREVKRLEGRPVGRRLIAAQDAGTGQRNAPRRRIWDWAGGSQQTGLLECFRVPKPTYFLVPVDMQTKLLALSVDKYVVAACSGSGCRGATQGNGLAPLSGYDPIPTPPPNNRVSELP